MKGCLAAVLTTFCLVSAHADNAALSTGGLPRMMSGGSNVSMVNESVKGTVYGEYIDTECVFVLANKGPACNVKIGFPDLGLWAYDNSLRVRDSFFQSFRLIVDGKPVRSKLEFTNEPGTQWQTIQMTFPKNGIKTIRQEYRTAVGCIANKAMTGLVSFVMRTGTGWSGPIGPATVIFTFDSETEVRAPLNLLFLASSPVGKAAYMSHATKPGGIIATGMSKPNRLAASVLFRHDSWKPAKADDIYLYYLFPRKVLARQQEELKHAIR